ncbi:MAG: YggT family protein [Chloroflexota bacterium]|jgi:YggT family protein|nr:YggT family protein [Chloroflexia bacterium]MDQ3444473.1 YggT family protein [Chloroflexota bacterium]
MDLAGFLLTILNILTILLVARALFSWFDPGLTTPIGKFLRDVTEPIVAPVRQVIPPMGMLDLSIMVTMLLLIVLRQLIASALA